jgi:hypothetical protein
MVRQFTKLGDGNWFIRWDCGVCMDSGVIKTLLGPKKCDCCDASMLPISSRLFGAVSLLFLKNQLTDDPLFNMARALVSASSEAPILGEALAYLIGCDERMVKRLAKRLKDEWHLPVIGRREKPFGYHYAANMEEMLAASRVTRAQAISELATDYRLLKTNSPIFAGQTSMLDFVSTVSTELQEAIR